MSYKSILCTAAATTVFLTAFCAAAVGAGTTATLAMYTTLYASVLNDEELRDLELVLVGLVLGSVASAGVAVLSATLGSHCNPGVSNQADMVAAEEAGVSNNKSCFFNRLASQEQSSISALGDYVKSKLCC